MKFYLLLYMFYPATTTFYRDLHQLTVVMSIFILIFSLINHKELSFVFRENSHAKHTLIFWITISIISWSPVLLENYLIQGTFPGLHRGSSTLKTTVFTISSVLFTFLPMIFFRYSNFNKGFIPFLTKLAAVYLFLSFVRYIFIFDFIPQSYAEVHSHGFRMTGFSMPDPNGFGRQLLLPLMYILAFCVLQKKEKKRSYFIIAIIMIAAILLSLSRTTYISAFSGILFLFFISLKRIKYVLLIIIGFVFLLAQIFNITDYFSPGEDRNNLSNLEGRQNIYIASYYLIMDNPLFGAFPGGYIEAMHKYGMPSDFYVSAHSMLLSVATEWGIPMTLVLLIVLLYSIKQGILNIKRIRKLNEIDLDPYFVSLCYAGPALAFAYLIHGLTEIIPLPFVFFNYGIVIYCNNHIKNQLKFLPGIYRPQFWPR